MAPEGTTARAAVSTEGQPAGESAPAPGVQDPARLAAVAACGLAPVRPIPQLDRLTAMAAREAGVPVALVSVVDAVGQLWPGAFGVAAVWDAARRTPMSHSLCQYVVASDDEVEIPDTARDPRSVRNLARSELSVGAYLGVPIRDPDGQVLGAFCLIDTTAREWTDLERVVARDSAQLAESWLNTTVFARQRSEAQARLRVSFADAPIGPSPG
jgi:GAF domain-containing protein